MEHRKIQTAAKSVKQFIEAGNRKMGYFGDLVEVLVIDCDTNVARFR